MKRFVKMLVVAMAVMIVMLSFSGMAFASEAETDVLKPINNIIDLAYTVIAVIGGGFIAFGVFQFATSLSNHDTNQKITGLMTIAGGVICTLVKSLVSFIAG